MAANHCAHNVPAKRLLSIKELVAYIGATEWFFGARRSGMATYPTSRSAKRCLLAGMTLRALSPDISKITVRGKSPHQVSDHINGKVSPNASNIT